MGANASANTVHGKGTRTTFMPDEAICSRSSWPTKECLWAMMISAVLDGPTVLLRRCTKTPSEGHGSSPPSISGGKHTPWPDGFVDMTKRPRWPEKNQSSRTSQPPRFVPLGTATGGRDAGLRSTDTMPSWSARALLPLGLSGLLCFGVTIATQAAPLHATQTMEIPSAMSTGMVGRRFGSNQAHSGTKWSRDSRRRISRSSL
mmetsp:Transcript_28437/g.60294  ORF Transcript_28437/g.60294 Transcript_28437/m.60294 type:complete len:203 (+) Transcript_28437:1102-1710(+)